MTFTQSKPPAMPSMFWNWQWPRDIHAHWENDRHLVVDVESEGSEVVVVEEGTEEYHRLFPFHEEEKPLPPSLTKGDVAILVGMGLAALSFIAALGIAAYSWIFL